MRVKRIIVHNSGGLFSRAGKLLLGVGNYLRRRDFSSYHFVVDRDRAHYRRRISEQDDSLDIYLVGDFSRKYPGYNQTRNLVGLLVQACRKFSIPSQEISGNHVGRRLNMQEIRELVGQHLFVDSLLTIDWGDET